MEPKLPVLDGNFKLFCPLAIKMSPRLIRAQADVAFQLNKNPNTRLPEYKHPRFPGQILYTYALNDPVFIHIDIQAQNHMVIDSAGFFLDAFTRSQRNEMKSERPCLFSEFTSFESYYDARFVF
ncbi:BgTH12-06739 [Blumeria graminis f. sp. triticale]|uniref:Bgt_BCG-3 n=3 Tax=Blumeria graminis TaxID=34373 RepID=A0A9X9LC95_BLUGR|nr:BgTH12-06739 [Blumeria graminis f. sp. triticale]VCU41353.1 Bgt_BCG-3 [Blumeria graminis f. sp. tritici]